MDDFPFPQEPDGVVDVRVVAEPQNVVVGGPGLLLGGHVLRQVRHGIALHRQRRRRKGESGGRGRIDPPN